MKDKLMPHSSGAENPAADWLEKGYLGAEINCLHLQKAETIMDSVF